jgi:hypothetical protein
MNTTTRNVRNGLSWCDAAYQVLKNENRPMGPTELGQKIAASRLVKSKSRTPINTIYVCIYQDISAKGPRSRFMKFGKKIGLSEWAGKSEEYTYQTELQTTTQTKYWKCYAFKEVPDKQLLSLVRSEIQDIRSFLNGQTDGDVSQEKLCFWVWFCYQLGLYWEGSLVFRKINPLNLPPPLYQAVKKVGIACENRRDHQ